MLFVYSISLERLYSFPAIRRIIKPLAFFHALMWHRLQNDKSRPWHGTRIKYIYISNFAPQTLQIKMRKRVRWKTIMLNDKCIYIYINWLKRKIANHHRSHNVSGYYSIFIGFFFLLSRCASFPIFFCVIQILKNNFPFPEMWAVWRSCCGAYLTTAWPTHTDDIVHMVAYTLTHGRCLNHSNSNQLALFQPHPHTPNEQQTLSFRLLSVAFILFSFLPIKKDAILMPVIRISISIYCPLFQFDEEKKIPFFERIFKYVTHILLSIWGIISINSNLQCKCAISVEIITKKMTRAASFNFFPL